MRPRNRLRLEPGVGRHVIDEHPAQAKKALAALREKAKSDLEAQKELEKLEDGPQTIVSASAIGYYGPRAYRSRRSLH